ncbi:hypothetical protein [Chroococcidiopsis sp. TS-821]|uniref:hypothetical protein n=1 Tax=Chroococcidiopsis sp. TS-821 TaxID=1378066 RepID=UPI000CEE128B|nr:hypothetical protein [Chroococcidiopsis sp. TS-821]PPS44095.1 hypothetical protein B1A85_08970 [Chroococcidiopsis sp. TS-821]
MVRKRIADLLNEEGEKLTSEQSSSEADATNNEESSNEENTEVVKSTRTTARSRNTNRTRQSQTASDTEGIVAELRAALKQAQEKEKSLEHRIAELLVELEDEKALVKQLRQDVANFDAVNAELEQAKSTILQLVEANSKLIEQVNSLKKEPAPLQKKETESQPQPKYKPARQTVVFPQQEQVDSDGESTDFARNTWLL